MKSKVAEELRRETEEAVRGMSPVERMALALSLGARALRNFAAARGLTRNEALRLIEQQKQQGRRYSRCIEELDRDTPC
jgi:hypothetical protein